MQAPHIFRAHRAWRKVSGGRESTDGTLDGVEDKLPVYIRTELKNLYFDSKKNNWIEAPDRSKFTYTDAEHLDATSGSAYTKWFLNKVLKN